MTRARPTPNRLQPAPSRTGFSLSCPASRAGFSLPCLAKRDRLPPVPPSRPAFTLTELLVVVSIVLLLMTLLGNAVSAARNGAKISSTRATIDKLNTILTTQLATYDSRSVAVPASLPSGIPTRSSYRAWFIRRHMITGDLPDRWADVQFMATPANGWVPQSPSQRAYIAVWNSAASPPSSTYAGAECLFMIVMRGGIADCLDCGALRTTDIGDKDGDGMPEFWDAWGNPIGFILWPCAFELPAGTGNRFFSGSRAPTDPFPAAGPAPSPTLGLRPLIYSAGPDGEYSFDRQSETANLNAGSNPVGRDCGNWNVTPASLAAGLSLVDGVDYRADNITNFDAEARQ